MSFREVKPGLKVVTKMFRFSDSFLLSMFLRMSWRLVFQAFSKASVCYDCCWVFSPEEVLSFGDAMSDERLIF